MRIEEDDVRAYRRTMVGTFMPGLRYIPGVVTLTLDRDRCTGCAVCVDVCPHGVFTVEDAKARIADRDACMECGACALNCVPEAISVRAGVGCAVAVLHGMLHRTDPSCSCGDTPSCCD